MINIINCKRLKNDRVIVVRTANIFDDREDDDVDEDDDDYDDNDNMMMMMIMMMLMMMMASPWLETSSWWQAGTERLCP